jgi:hypothetical protein
MIAGLHMDTKILKKSTTLENTLKNKTIQILTKGDWTLPVGTKVNTYADKSNPSTGSGVHTVDEDTSTYFIDSDNKGPVGHIYEVDFSDVPKLYPSKGMEVGKDGIEFVTHDRTLFLVGEYGFSGRHNSNLGPFLTEWEWFENNKNSFELKRTLPKTKTVCAECHKEVCECKHESGYYRIKICGEWTVRYYDKKSAYFYHTDAMLSDTFRWGDGRQSEIDWANPINVTPESEVKA